ncbi:MAG TPA: type II toxin-antitoxin system VapC family toxin [Candidatus Sulfotelmatobacter sp.]|nr:type II toxin-antitoxin system VapC family toxin [Candidatus Sulfotelmatobacter sp.]
MLFLDTSALVKRYVAEEGTELVLRRMAEDPEWVAAALARAEAAISLCRLGFDSHGSADTWRLLREDWARCHVVPLDPACLELASELGCAHQLRTLDALHLAAARRLPQPLVLLTFDRRQADAARAIGLIVEGA